MIGLVAILLVTGLVVVVFGAVVIGGLSVGSSAFELAHEPTCLLCESSDLEQGPPPQYRCRACGFDTSKVDLLHVDLETYRDLNYALAELRLAERELSLAVVEPESEPSNSLPVAGPLIETVRKHQMAAFDHLRDVCSREHELLNMPVGVEKGVGVARADALNELRDYMGVVNRIRGETGARILIQMTADGDPDAARRPLDFEHAMPTDYED